MLARVRGLEILVFNVVTLINTILIISLYINILICLISLQKLFRNNNNNDNNNNNNNNNKKKKKKKKKKGVIIMIIMVMFDVCLEDLHM